MHGYTRNLPALQNCADFPASYLQPCQFQLISKLFEGGTSALSENWRPFAPFVREKASLLAALVKIHDHSHISTAPSCLFRIVM